MTWDPIAVQIWAPNSFWERRTVLSKLMELKGRSWRSLFKGPWRNLFLMLSFLRKKDNIRNRFLQGPLKRDRQLLPLSSINFERTVLRSQKELGAHIWTAIGSQVIFSVGDLRWSRTATINQDNWLQKKCCWKFWRKKNQFSKSDFFEWKAYERICFGMTKTVFEVLILIHYH